MWLKGGTHEWSCEIRWGHAVIFSLLPRCRRVCRRLKVSCGTTACWYVSHYACRCRLHCPIPPLSPLLDAGVPLPSPRLKVSWGTSACWYVSHCAYRCRLFCRISPPSPLIDARDPTSFYRSSPTPPVLGCLEVLLTMLLCLPKPCLGFLFPQLVPYSISIFPSRILMSA